MNDINVAEMARELVEKKANSWTKSDKKKYGKILKKIFRAAEKGCTSTTISTFTDWSRVYRQLERDGFIVENFPPPIRIMWDNPKSRPDSSRLKPPPPKAHYVTEGKKVK